MRHAYRKMRGLLSWVFVCLIISGCVVGGPKVWPEIQGVVLDKRTGDPIEDVYVTAYYGGYYYYVIESQGTCYEEVTTKTDKNGRFNIRAKVEIVNRAMNRNVSVGLYKDGMEPTDFYMNYIPDPAIYYMNKSSKTGSARIKSIMRSTYVGGCGFKGEVSKTQDEMQVNGYIEALTHVEDDDDLGLLESMRYTIASSWNDKADSLSDSAAEQIFSERYEYLLEMTPRVEKPVSRVISIDQKDQFTGSPSVNEK